MSPSHADFAVGNRSSQKQAGRGPKKAWYVESPAR
jgi:hypothetical protein